MRTFHHATEILLLVFVGGISTSCTVPFEATDPRVGEYIGSFSDCGGAPKGAVLRIRSTGDSVFESDINLNAHAGSVPGRLQGGTDEVDFDFTHNSVDKQTGYSVRGQLAEDGQTVKGTLSYWTRPHGHASRKEGPSGCNFAVRRLGRDPRFAPAIPGDFSCASRVETLQLHVDFNTVEPTREPDAPVPRPSCFDGDLRATHVVVAADGEYTISASKTYPNETQTASFAFFSACDGAELICVKDDTAPGDRTSSITLRLAQAEDAIVVVDGDDIAFDMDWIGR